MSIRQRYCLIAIFFMALVTGCNKRPVTDSELFLSQEYTVYADSVVDNDAVFRLSPKPHTPQESFPIIEMSPALPRNAYEIAVDSIVNHSQSNSKFLKSPLYLECLSIALTTAYLQPDKAKEILRAHVLNSAVIHSQNWPISADCIAWGDAAWEIYNATGDTEWLREAFQVLRRTVAIDIAAAWNSSYNLMQGISCNMSNDLFPEWMTTIDRYESLSLLVNVMYSRVLCVMGWMSEILGIDGSDYSNLSQLIASAINQRLWIPNKGCYSEYLYGGVFPNQSPVTDNLAQALSVIHEIATPEMSQLLLEKTWKSVYGTPLLSSSEESIFKSHSWPLMQTLWVLACNKSSCQTLRDEGLAAFYRSVTLNGINSHNASSAIATIFKILAGISFKTDRITFAPNIPTAWKGKFSIKDFRYRDATLDININGSGYIISSFFIDGQRSDYHIIESNITGKHTIDINLFDPPQHSKLTPFTQVDIPSIPPTPLVNWTDSCDAIIKNYDADFRYHLVMDGGASCRIIDSPLFKIPSSSNYATFTIVPQTANGGDGYCCKPLVVLPTDASITIEADMMAKTGTYLLKDRKLSKQVVEITPYRNQSLLFDVDVPKAGTYIVDLYYSNGTGSSDNINRCAIRQLAVNNLMCGTFIMPCQGTGIWTNFSWSNRLEIELKKGPNRFNIYYKVPYTVNIDGSFNNALIRSLRLIQKKTLSK